MITPRDSIVTSAPVNSDTGKPLTESQLKHLEAIKTAGAALYDAMHAAEGSMPPGHPYEEHHWGGRRMAHAATLVETALMFARKAALE